jgi:hypothetical protein
VLRDLNSPWREQGYRCLIEHYRACGETEKAGSIAAELNQL